MTGLEVLENVLIIAGEGFFILSNFSQLRKLMATRDTKGLSAPNQTLNCAGNIAWMTYFGLRLLWTPVFTNLINLILTALTLRYTLSNKNNLIKGLVAILIIGSLTGFLLIIFPKVSGWVGVTYNAIAGLPWLVRIITTKKTSGISEKSLFFTLVAIFCTFVYALLTNSVPQQVGCIIGITSIVIVMTYYYRYRLAR
jgi:uncharacterized protein with PQ loop repeat